MAKIEQRTSIDATEITLVATDHRNYCLGDQAKRGKRDSLVAGKSYL